jgi:hypothetical protein
LKKNCQVKKKFHLTLTQECQLLFQFALKVKVYCKKKFKVTSKKASNPSKMASDQNEKCTIGIKMVKTLYREVTVPLPEEQGNSLFCIGSTDLSPPFFQQV